MASDYKYDVFFSYKRHDLTINWMREVSKRLELWLTESLGDREAKVFVDEADVEIGDRWPDRLRHAVKYSRCLVCVWTPSYFQSSWCVSEWQSFLEREKLLNIEVQGLIAPLKFHDGEHFPEEARRVGWEDVAPYASTVPAFWNSAKAIELEARLKAFAESVAQIIRRAPRFCPDWPIVESHGLAPPRIELARL